MTIYPHHEHYFYIRNVLTSKKNNKSSKVDKTIGSNQPNNQQK